MGTPPLPVALEQMMGLAGFSHEHQRTLLGVMLTRPRFARTNVGVIIPEHFDQQIHQHMARWVLDFSAANQGSLPSREFLQFQINDATRGDHNQAQVWNIELESCYSSAGGIGADDVVNQYLGWCRDNRIKALLFRALEDANAGREVVVSDLAAKLKQADAYIDLQADLGVKLFKDDQDTLDVMSDKYDRRFIATGDAIFDRHLQGGPGIGEMLMYVAPPKTGKTTRMMHDIKLYSMGGYPGVFISGEQRTFNLARRIAESIVGQNAKVFKDTAQGQWAWQHWVQHFKNTQAPIYIQNMYKFTPDDVGRYIERCSADLGQPMRYAVVDYLNLMKTPGKQDHRHELSKLCRDLRDVFIDLDVVGITATQGNRSTADQEYIKKEGIAEDYELTGIADVVVTVSQPEELAKKNIMNLLGAASRIGGGFWKMQYRTELEFARLHAIEVGTVISTNTGQHATGRLG